MIHEIGDLLRFPIYNRRSHMVRRFLCAVALTTASVTGAVAQDASDDKARVTLVYDHVLPNVPGKSISAISSVDTLSPSLSSTGSAISSPIGSKSGKLA